MRSVKDAQLVKLVQLLYSALESTSAESREPSVRLNTKAGLPLLVSRRISPLPLTNF